MYGLLFGVSLFLSVVLLVCLFKVRSVTIARFLFAGTLLVAFWLLMESLTYFIRIEEADVLFQKAKFAAIMFIPPLYVLTADEYAGQKRGNIFLKLLLFVVPFLSLLSLTTNFIPYPFLSNARVVFTDGIPVFSYRTRIGVVIHDLYSYANIILACYTFMIKALRAPKLYRRQSRFIFLGSVLAFIVNLLAITIRVSPKYVDATAVSMLATLIILYWGLFRLPKSVTIPLARELLIENIEDMTIVADASNRIIDINPAAVEFAVRYGHAGRYKHAPNFIGIPIQEVMGFIPDLEIPEMKTEKVHKSDLVFPAQEKTFYFRMYQSPIYDTDHSKIGRLFMIHDTTQMQEYVNSLKCLNTELQISDRVINSALEGIVITDASGRIIRVNSAFEKMSGYEYRDLIGSNPRILKSGRHDKQFYTDMWNRIIEEGFWEGEIWDKKKSGEIYPKWMSITSLKEIEGRLENYIAVSTDISKIKKAEEELHRLAYYDSLTGIPNRTLFYERLELALVRAKDMDKMVALLFMDLDGFKIINDSLGHAAGDMLLKEVAARIQSCIRKYDTVSRLGGDEFTVILENVSDLDYVKGIAEAIIDKILLPYHILDRELTLGVSIGIALYPNDENTVEGLVRKSDAAMYDAKEAGKGRYSFSSEEIERRNHEILEMQIKLKKALEEKEFTLYLQPQLSFEEGRFRVIGAEALIRWQTADGQIFTPDRFITVAENNGMIIPIGNWILEEVYRIDRVLKEHGISLALAVNVSSKQLEKSDFAARVRELAERNREQNINLVVEITESFLLKDLDKAIESMMEIKELGIGIALDDFGTGFSSLNYLTRLPIDYLKIDKSFIDDIANPKHKNLTPTIISMAKTLGLKTVAEGVETKEQIDRLLAERCDELQGYYFSRPVDIPDFIRYIERFE